ncbi:DUF4236 domain-containing protein [Dickeya dianthicola]|uniref:DUF4236 domain-containing protein n=2 Tax=Pectobacteriaceae TaxID=1903410 RepID=UPI0034D561DC
MEGFMGLCFMKRIKIAFGLYLNMSSGCTNWSIGVPSATLNVGEGKVQRHYWHFGFWNFIKTKNR